MSSITYKSAEISSSIYSNDDVRTRILLAEDESLVALALSHALISFGYNVIKVVSRGSDLIAESKRFNPDLIITDIYLKDKITGVQALQELDFDRRRVIIISGNSDPETLRLVAEVKPCKFFLKPFTPLEIHNTIRDCLRTY
jgi:DNA-binding NarL/FixJ family response regulator